MLRRRIRRFTDIGVGSRILIGFGLGALLLTVVTAYAIASLARMAEGERQLVRVLDVRKAARALDVDVLNIIVTLNEYVDTRDPALLSELERRRYLADQLRAQIRRLTDRPVAIEALNRYEAILPYRRQLANQLIAAVQSGGASERATPAFAALLSERRRLDREARALLLLIMEEQDVTATRQQAQHRNLSANIRRNMILSGGLAITLMIVLALAITRTITEPIARLHDVTDRIGLGDFSARSDVSTRDEIGDFARALNAMAADVGRLDEAKSEFIGLVSHQLRTPATAVKNAIGLLREGYTGPLTEEQMSFVEMAWESNEQQLATIDAMLRVANADAGRLVLRPQPLELIALVSRVIEQQRQAITDRDQSCELQAEDGPIVVEGDRDYLPMAIENILSNASKYTQPRGSIAVSVRRAGANAIVAVKDSGVGVSEDQLSRLFGKFSRIDNPLSATVGGNGIGLYLTKRIIELHHGSIEVESHLGAGTTFTLALPLQPTTDDGESSGS